MKKMPKVVHKGEECFFDKETRRLSPVGRPWESIALSEFQYAHYVALTTPVFFAPKH
ncbi:hypothetical protein PDESU_02451 [Pontiella desulfatans]|uniref:Uncharacterized protein n=1 Tax=Pontiella desulfatans TaxID=2750659 RepID=A0A6C2U2L1_PONDE|nr:hypothetical protein [Pontiella desulfatans]VGO13894.1 hypothetical protein PDESU_02451 [Pontiella desulfatans]